MIIALLLFYVLLWFISRHIDSEQIIGLQIFVMLIFLIIFAIEGIVLGVIISGYQVYKLFNELKKIEEWNNGSVSHTD